jgi:acyl-CoA synthetase (AMP-forming)/AMP-acid ligase II
VVPKGDSCEVVGIRRHCLSFLPRYLIPTIFHVVSALPRTGTGKIDRRALAASR